MKETLSYPKVRLVSLTIVIMLISMTIMPVATGDPLFSISIGDGDSGAGTTSDFGWNVSKAGDVNGDGVTDIIVGAPNADYNSVTDCGAAFIFFGYEGMEDGDLNASNANVSIYGTVASGHFGWDVSDAGDVNGGNADVIIGEPDNGNGKAYIYYGSGSMTATMTTASADITLTGGASGDGFGASVSGAGDIDNDNFDDIVIGAPYADASGTDRGMVYVHQGAVTMSTIPYMTFSGKVNNGHFGWSVSGLGDIDNDNKADFAIGEPGNDMAYVYSNGLEYIHADGETAVYGSVTNDYTETQTQDDSPYEQIAEESITPSNWTFESDNGDFTVSGGVWEWGVPTNGPTSTLSGTKCWGTDLDANYPNSMNTYLISPEYDLTGATTPALTFWNWYTFEAYFGGGPPSGRGYYDGGHVLYTINGGTNWYVLGGDSSPPYDDTVKSLDDGPVPDSSDDYQGFTGAGEYNTGWVQESFDLSSYVDNTIQFKFHCTSDTANNNPGWYIDDIDITGRPSQKTLEHIWNFTLSPCESATFEIDSYVSTENVKLYYSTTGTGTVGGAGWIDMSITVSQISDIDNYQTYSDASLASVSGKGYIGARDLTQAGDSTTDTFYIDHMRISCLNNLLALTGESNTDFGWSVGGAGDVNDDGNDDVIVGAPGATNGDALVYYGGAGMGYLTDSITNDTQAEFDTGTLLSTYAVSAGDVNLTNPQNFDAQTTTEDPGGWTINEAGGSVEVSSEQSVSASNSVKLTDTTDRVNVSKLSIPLPTTFTIEFDARVTATDQWFQLIAPSSTYSAGIQILFYTDGTIIYYDGAIHVLQTYNADQWYHFQLDVDCVAFTYDISIDGTLMQADAALLNDVQVGIITFATGTASTVAYLDNVKVENYIYDTYGHMESETYTISQNIEIVKPTWSATLNDQTMTVKVSRDGGTTYSPALTSGIEYAFTNSEPAGDQLRYKVEMNGDGSATPVLHSITVDYMCPASNVTFTGPASGDRFGFSVGSAGDIDGDNIGDIIVGAPFNDTSDGSKANGGGVFAFSGGAYLSGTVSATNANYTYFGETAGDILGWSVGPAGNVNVHGKDDIVVGAPYYDSNAGRAYALSIAIPMKVTSFTVAENSGDPLDIDISWITVNGAIKYNIYRSESPWGFDFATPITTINAPTTSWTDTSAPRNTTNAHNATTYYYAIRAENALASRGPYKVYAIHRLDLVAGWNMVSWLSNETKDIETEAFANLEADDGANPTTYIYDKVERWHPASQVWESYTTDGDLGNFSDMAAGYAYAIQCRVNTVWTYIEDCGSPTFCKAPAALSAPATFTLGRNSTNPNYVDLDWSAVGGATQYNVYRSFSKWGFDFNDPIHTTSDTWWNDTTATQENGEYNISVYYYVVRAEDGSGNIEKNLNVAAMHRMDFRYGIDYMSWVIHDSVSEATALASLTFFADYIGVEQWDESNQAFNPAVTDFERGYGYGIYILTACTWTYVEYA